MGAVASVLLKDDPCYARRSFVDGLLRYGFSVQIEPLEKPSRHDLLVLWNRLPTQDAIAKRYEEAGARVLIAENGWIGEGNYALCRSHHNGAGTWHVGETSRWPNFGIALKPWREKGDHILVLPQRGMGIPGVAMPRAWAADVSERLAKVTDRPIRIRYPQERDTPLDFTDCHAAVTWGSGAGIKAIVAGIPVFYEMPNWIGAPGALFGIDYPENPFATLLDRTCMLHRLSWAMWKREEIESGEPFECVLL